MTLLQRSCLFLLCFSSLLLPVTILSVQARVVYVDTRGKDDSTCGEVSHPCRSIGQAHAHASEGDAIVVGPGRYGDVNGDGDFDDPGEGSVEAETGCHCLVKIDKQITIESSAGPEATVIDAGDRAQYAVQIQANQVAFGRAKRGFTVTNSHGPGIVIGQHTNGVRVEGNTIKSNRAMGIEVHGSSHRVMDNVILANRRYGIMLFPGEGHEIRRNVIRNNGAGGILTFAHDILIAENTLASNNPDRGCDLINSSTAELRLSPNVWGTVRTHIPGSPPTICNQGGSRTTLIHTVQRQGEF